MPLSEELANSAAVPASHFHAWDSFDTYLFDIDGTLLNCRDAVHYFAFCDALSAIAGRPLSLDGVQTHGNTDVGILADALRLAGVPEHTWRPRFAEMQLRMSTSVLRDKARIDAELTPGIVEVLTHLRTRGALLGVATGNLEPIGWAKLRRAGLRELFSFGSFSSEAPTRTEIFAAGTEKARVIRGTAASLCIVGDTPADITSAHANGLPVIAVATGSHTREQLEREQPTWCVASLQELLPA